MLLLKQREALLLTQQHLGQIFCNVSIPQQLQSFKYTSKLLYFYRLYSNQSLETNEPTNTLKPNCKMEDDLHGLLNGTKNRICVYVFKPNAMQMDSSWGSNCSIVSV